MNNNDGKFSAGFLLGILIGGGLVFLLGTKTGKNLLKIISEQGVDGLTNFLEEYDIDDDLEEYEEVEDEDLVNKDKVRDTDQNDKTTSQAPLPKKRFFKRIRR